ncbi:hypothetical protein BDW62DRAFT_204734 [Aspergillus aurantiobrunneus]
MAEVFGAVTGAISIVTALEQVIQSIERLRALRSFIKTLPHELQSLIEEIEIVHGVLKTLTPEMFEFLNVPSTERRLGTFQDDLERLIDEIQRYKSISAGRRKMGAVKLALKKEEIRAQRRNLDGIKGTLLLLQQAYFSASIRDFGSMLRTHRTGTSMTGRSSYSGGSKDEDGQISKAHTAYKRPAKPQQSTAWEYRFRTPLVIIDKMWTLQARRLFSGCTFSIRVNNVIPNDAPVFKYCQEGNVKQVQKLFAERAASPYDCDSRGNSLLNYAAVYLQLELCRLLVQNGADQDHKNSAGLDPLTQINRAAGIWLTSPEKVPLLVDLYRLFIDNFQEYNEPHPSHGNETEDSEPRWISTFRGPPEALTLIHQKNCPGYSSLPLATRFKRTMALGISHKGPSVFCAAMGGTIPPAAFHLETESGETLQQKVWKCAARNLSMGRRRPRSEYTREWRALLADAIRAGADPNKVSWKDGGRRTALGAFMESFTWNERALRRERYDFNPIVRLWVSELRLAGVDLGVFGARERRLYATADIDLEFFVVVGGPRGERLPFRILDLVYGPEPEDWRIWVTNPVDEMVGEFWKMMERKEEVMPGTWVE